MRVNTIVYGRVFTWIRNPLWGVFLRSLRGTHYKMGIYPIAGKFYVTSLAIQRNRYVPMYDMCGGVGESLNSLLVNDLSLASVCLI